MRIVYTKKQVKKGCACRTEMRREKTICRCLKKPAKARRTCVRGRMLTIKYYFRKVCKRFFCRCVLSKRFFKKVIRKWLELPLS